MQEKQNKGLPLCRDLRPEWTIFIPAVVLIFLISIPSVIDPVASEKYLNVFYRAFSNTYGSLYLWLTLGLIIMCVFFAMSPYGNIKFGGLDEKPEYNIFSWISMIFCSGVAGASMFWAIVEPQWNLINPPQHAVPMSVEAFEWSLAYLFLHWGPNAWVSYFVCALPIAYIFHIRNTPKLRISSTIENIIGKQKDGIIGRCVDIFFIIGLLLCTSATMVLSLPTVEAALATVFGLTPSFSAQVYILVGCSFISATSLYLGLKKGIQTLSNLNVIIALIMIFYAFVLGPTSTIFDIFTNSVGKMLGNYMNMSLWTDPFTEGTFPQDWTIFYTLFWASYGPFMGLFIARISRGRTVREIILWGMLGTIGSGYLIHGVFGSYTLHLQYSGILDVVNILQTQGGPASMMAVLDSLPFGSAVILAYCAYSVIFLATSIDSSCYIIASTATRSMDHNEDPGRVHRVFWAIAQAILTLGALAVGGIGVAKIYGSFGGAFMVLPIVLLAVSWLKIIRVDGPSLLAFHVVKPNTDNLRPLFEDECQ